MTRRWTIFTVLLLVALPSVLYGRWIKDKVYLQTDSVGKVEFSHYAHMEMESIGKDCPACHAPMRSIMQVDCRVCGEPIREGELFGVPIRRKAEPRDKGPVQLPGADD